MSVPTCNGHPYHVFSLGASRCSVCDWDRQIPGQSARGAVLSDDGRYRYLLWRQWNDGLLDDKPMMTFVMLNPSIADASIDDPTVRKCVGYAKREDCDGIQIVNLFAFRSSTPGDLLTAADPRGPENADYVRRAIQFATGPIVVAWGAWWDTNQAKRFGKSIPRLGVETYAERFGRRLHCLGTTKAGAPRHPLYVKADQPLEVFR